MWIGGQDQGGGVRQIAALFGHSDNAEPVLRDQASRPSLFPTDSLEPVGDRDGSNWTTVVLDTLFGGPANFAEVDLLKWICPYSL